MINKSLRINDICHKIKNINIKETIPIISCVDYPVRIHSTTICCCKRVKAKLNQIKLKEGEQIAYIIEKLWDDKQYKHKPPVVYVTCPNGDTEKKEALFVLNLLFQCSLNGRKLINEYFKNYEWSPCKSIKVRNIVRQLKTVCYCLNNLTIDMTTCNAGFILIGSRSQMQTISHTFNQKVTKTEFSKLFYHKVSTLKSLKKNEIGYSVFRFMKSNAFDILSRDDSKYTITGLIKDTYLKQKEKPSYNFPFGKREWCLDSAETSLECARRELYEEFNIQFSLSVWSHSRSQHMHQHIYFPGFILYFLYLPQIMSIKYHITSETIYLN